MVIVKTAERESSPKCLISSVSNEPVVYYVGTIYTVVIVKTAELYYAGPNIVTPFSMAAKR